jgi:outer membrane protein assembly factor BamB/subtilisin family serine protease
MPPIEGTTLPPACLRRLPFHLPPWLKVPLSCFLALVVGVFANAATNPNPASAPVTAKEIAQGYREHTVLARPHLSRRATADADESREGVHVRQKFPRFGDLRVIDLPDSDSADAALARLRATGRYEFVEPDHLYWLQTAPNDPKYTDGSLWAMNNTGQSGGTAGADIHAPLAWGIVHDAPSVVVAVVDTGINLNHQDIAANLWTNPSPTQGDLHGANFVGGNGSMVSGNPTDDDGHGTHVAGTIGAVGNNGVAVTGVAWKVQLMAVKVFPANAPGTESDIIAGINYAIAHGANIINASYGANGTGSFYPAEFSAITAARNAGVIFVAAAGNDTANLDISRAYPASYALDNIVTVGASTRYDDLASFSNFGAAVDLVAPGQDIVSLNYANNTGTAILSGTSMATPHVTGALALLKAAFPTDSYRQLINRLLRGVDRVAAFSGKAQTNGRLNLYGALTAGSNLPFNDSFASRPHFNTDNVAIRTSNVGATAETNEPAHAGVAASATLWWEWTAQSTGTVTLDTNGSAYDTVLAVYTGNSVDALTLVGSNDNDGSSSTSRVRFAAQAGTTYEIAVGGKNGAAGLTLLNLGSTPANDAFASPVTLTGESLHLSATNAHCSRETGEPKILGLNGGTSLWYRWTAPRSGRFQVAVISSDFDPLLAVYTGDTITALTLVTANDNASTDPSQTGALCTIDAIAGTTYDITVDSKSATSVGQFTLNLVDSVWQATTGDSITGAPAVAGDGTVYVGSVDHSLYAFTADGASKWSYPTGGSIDTCSPAVADDGTVYVGSNDGKLYALNPSGTLKWSHNFNTGTASVYAGCSPTIAADGTVYIRVTDGFLHALNPADGSERWKTNVNSTVASFYGSPVIGTDGTIYAGSDETDHTLYAIAANGTPKWTASLDSGAYGVPALDGAGNLYVVTLTGGVYSFTPAGIQRWHVTSGGNISSSVALSADGSTLYYGGYDAQLYARDTANGAQRWACPLGAEVRASSPAIDTNGVIYIGSYDYKLYAVTPGGAVKRTYDMGNWVRSGPAIAGTRLYVGSNDQKLYAFDLGASAGNGPWPQYRNNARRTGRQVAEPLAITAQPQSQTAVTGQPLTLSVTATGTGPLYYQWMKDGAAISGATGATYTVGAVDASAAGNYSVTVSGPQGTLTSGSATVSVDAANPGRLTNVSVRNTAGSGSQTLIAGFVISGTGSKPLLVRGVGPALAGYEITDALAAPQLLVLEKDSGRVVAQNTRWGGAPTLANTFASVGAFPLDPNSTDDALIATLPVISGGYTATITGANSTTGTALAEVYDLDPSTGSSVSSRLVNVSARSQVGTGNNVLVAGFSISGNVPKQLLIRGIGPGLAAYGVTGVLADPKLEIYRHGVLVQRNDDWGGDATLTAAFGKVAAFPLNDPNSKDAALLITLPPDSYTAQVSGVGDTTGVGLVEVYEVP